MKYCEKMESLLSVYFDGECTPEEAVRVREHLKSCSSCRQRLREYALLRKTFPDDFNLSVPPELSANVMSVIRSGGVPQSRRRCSVWKKILLPLAACLVIALALPNFSSCFLQNQHPAAIQTPALSSFDRKPTEQKKTVVSEKTSKKKAGKTLSSQKSSVSDSAAPDDDAATSADTAVASETGVGADTYSTNRVAVSAPYHKWISVTADAAGSLLDDFDGTADTDPVSGASATRYEMSAEEFSSIAAQISGVSVHVSSSTEATLCCVYVLSDH